MTSPLARLQGHPMRQPGRTAWGARAPSCVQVTTPAILPACRSLPHLLISMIIPVVLQGSNEVSDPAGGPSLSPPLCFPSSFLTPFTYCHGITYPMALQWFLWASLTLDR